MLNTRKELLEILNERLNILIPTSDSIRKNLNIINETLNNKDFPYERELHQYLISGYILMESGVNLEIIDFMLEDTNMENMYQIWMIKSLDQNYDQNMENINQCKRCSLPFKVYKNGIYIDGYTSLKSAINTINSLLTKNRNSVYEIHNNGNIRNCSINNRIMINGRNFTIRGNFPFCNENTNIIVSKYDFETTDAVFVYGNRSYSDQEINVEYSIARQQFPSNQTLYWVHLPDMTVKGGDRGLKRGRPLANVIENI